MAMYKKFFLHLTLSIALVGSLGYFVAGLRKMPFANFRDKVLILVSLVIGILSIVAWVYLHPFLTGASPMSAQYFLFVISTFPMYGLPFVFGSLPVKQAMASTMRLG